MGHNLWFRTELREVPNGNSRVEDEDDVGERGSPRGRQEASRRQEVCKHWAKVVFSRRQEGVRDHLRTRQGSTPFRIRYMGGWVFFFWG